MKEMSINRHCQVVACGRCELVEISGIDFDGTEIEILVLVLILEHQTCLPARDPIQSDLFDVEHFMAVRSGRTLSVVLDGFHIFSSAHNL